MATSKIQTGLRLGEKNYEKLRRISEKENRSFNNLVEYILQRFLDNNVYKNNKKCPQTGTFSIWWR